MAYRRRTSEVEYNFHFWRRVIHPLDAGGMFTIQRGDCVDVIDPAKRISYNCRLARTERRESLQEFLLQTKFMPQTSSQDKATVFHCLHENHISSYVSNLKSLALLSS